MDNSTPTPNIKGQLGLGIVLFTYTKKDSSVRHAVGTTHPDLVGMTYKAHEKKLDKVREQVAILNGLCQEDILEVEEVRQVNDNLIKQFFQPENRGTSSNEPKPVEEYINYYDFMSGEWRKFKEDNLLSVQTVLVK